jgi:hypothetical protein
MNKSIRDELKEHVMELIADGVINEDNAEDAHYYAFNNDYYIIGHCNAEKWLEKHGVNVWHAIEYVVEQDELEFGETTLTAADFNPERIVNLLAYYVGMELNFNNLLIGGA